MRDWEDRRPHGEGSERWLYGLLGTILAFVLPSAPPEASGLTPILEHTAPTSLCSPAQRPIPRALHTAWKLPDAGLHSHQIINNSKALLSHPVPVRIWYPKSVLPTGVNKDRSYQDTGPELRPWQLQSIDDKKVLWPSDSNSYSTALHRETSQQLGKEDRATEETPK